MSEDEVRAAIEAILLASAEPVSLTELKNAIGDAETAMIDSQITEIERRVEEHLPGLRLERVSGGFRFATRPELDPYLRKFFERRRENRLSIASLETLAIVAYRQPITAPEISELRGVNSSGVLKTLLDKKLVRIAGRKNVVGSPFLYRTTKEFLMHFGLEKIQDLPDLEEFGQLVGEVIESDLLLSELNSAEGGEAAWETSHDLEADEDAETIDAVAESGNEMADERDSDGSDEVPEEDAGESPGEAVAEDEAGAGVESEPVETMASNETERDG